MVTKFRVCKHCDAMFQRKTKWHIYCSSTCKQIAWYAKKIEQLKKRKK